MDRRTFLVGCSALLGLAAPVLPADPTAHDIVRLIEQLGSKRFRERESASKALEKMGEKALPALRKAEQSHADAEVRRQVAVLLNRMEKRAGPAVGLVRTFRGHTKRVCAAALSRDFQHILSSSEDGTVRLWDVATGRELHAYRYGKDQDELEVTLALSPDARHALLAGYGDGPRYVALPSGKTVRCFKGHSGSVQSVALSADGRHALSGGDDETGRLWDVATGKELQCFNAESDTGTDWTMAVTFVPGGRQIITGHGEGAVRLWDVRTGKAISSFQGHHSVVNSVAVSPRGDRVVSGSADGTVRLWDIQKGKPVRCLWRQLDRVRAVAFSPNGHRVLAGGDGRMLRLWNADSGKLLYQAVAHWSPVTSVAMSADGRFALSASADKTIRLWRLP